MEIGLGRNEREFTQFALEGGQRLLRTAEYLTRDGHDAEDLVQSALTKVYLAWSTARGVDTYAYARKVLVNQHIDNWRRRRWRETPMASVPDIVVTGDQDLGDWTSDRDSLIRALASINERERTIVVLRYCEDLPEKEVAGLLGVSIGTVKSTASRALSKMRHVADVEEAGEAAHAGR